MGRITREKQKILAVIFLGAGAWGIGISYMMPQFGDTSLYVTLLGVINLSLGGIVGYYYLTRVPVKSRKRKK
ncbi:MAG: hypothetical protein ACE5JT_04610 [Nitrosopumilaceae archaeon]